MIATVFDETVTALPVESVKLAVAVLLIVVPATVPAACADGTKATIDDNSAAAISAARVAKLGCNTDAKRTKISNQKLFDWDFSQKVTNIWLRWPLRPSTPRFGSIHNGVIAARNGR